MQRCRILRDLACLMLSIALLIGLAGPVPTQTGSVWAEGAGNLEAAFSEDAYEFDVTEKCLIAEFDADQNLSSRLA